MWFILFFNYLRVFPLRYMKYLYPYECERKGLSSPGELQAAIDSNRREGRRPSYSSSLFRFSPSPSTAPHILSPPKMHLSALGAGTSGALNGLQASPGPSLKKGTHLKSVQTHFDTQRLMKVWDNLSLFNCKKNVKNRLSICGVWPLNHVCLQATSAQMNMCK